MRRRSLLATAGSVLLAGCGRLERATTGAVEAIEGEQRIPPDVQPVDDIGIQGDIGIDDSIDIRPVDDIGIDRRVEIADDIGIPEGAGPEDDPELQGPGLDSNGEPIETNPRAADLIQRARDELSEAMDVYASYDGRNPTITDVNPTVERFNSGRVITELNQARQYLQRAEQFATMGQETMIMALGQCATFLENAAIAEEELNAAYDKFQFARERLFNGQYTQSTRARRRMRQHCREARTALRTMRETTEMAMMNAYDQISMEEYQGKLHQISTALDIFSSYKRGLRLLARGLRDIDTGATKYSNGNYSRAVDFISSALQDFRAARLEFSSPARGSPDSTPPTGLRDDGTELAVFARSAKLVLEDLERHTRAKAQTNRLVASEALAAAEQHFRMNPRLQEFDVWTGFPF
ncbi:MAG: hypothetical protein ABEJ30_07680 [Halorientalis sp.]